jgi:hypothetical protein
LGTGTGNIGISLPGQSLSYTGWPGCCPAAVDPPRLWSKNKEKSFFYYHRNSVADPVQFYPLDPELFFSGSRIFLTMTKTKTKTASIGTKKKVSLHSIFHVGSGSRMRKWSDPEKNPDPQHCTEISCRKHAICLPSYRLKRAPNRETMEFTTLQKHTGQSILRQTVPEPDRIALKKAGGGIH